jgi:hypothetical protein
MPVTIVKSNATVPTIPNDNYDVLANTSSYLFSVYQSVPFSMDLTFSLFEGPEEALVPVPITSVNATFTGYSSVTLTVANTDPLAYKIAVSGNLTNVIAGESYALLLEDGRTVNSPVNNLSDYVAVVGWNLPTPFSGPQEISTYAFTVSSNTSSQPVTMSQYVYWNFNTAVVNFKQAIAGGI